MSNDLKLMKAATGRVVRHAELFILRVPAGRNVEEEEIQETAQLIAKEVQIPVVILEDGHDIQEITDDQLRELGFMRIPEGELGAKMAE